MDEVAAQIRALLDRCHEARLRARADTIASPSSLQVGDCEAVRSARQDLRSTECAYAGEVSPQAVATLTDHVWIKTAFLTFQSDISREVFRPWANLTGGPIHILLACFLTLVWPVCRVMDYGLAVGTRWKVRQGLREVAEDVELLEEIVATWNRAQRRGARDHVVAVAEAIVAGEAQHVVRALAAEAEAIAQGALEAPDPTPPHMPAEHVRPDAERRVDALVAAAAAPPR